MSINLRPMGREPSRNWTCPACEITFKANNKIKDGRNGKECPNGHWHSLRHLAYFELHGRLPPPRGCFSIHDKADSKAKKNDSLSSYGISNRADQLESALQWMLSGYEKLVSQLPDGSMGRALVDGALARHPSSAERYWSIQNEPPMLWTH